LDFYDLGLCDELLDGLDAMNIRKPTPIQQQAIPIALEGNDLIACAQTGTGKTAAFVLPTMQQIFEKGNSGTQALILAPTRELVSQIDQQIEGLSYYVNISSIAVYGGGVGEVFDRQRKAFENGVDVIAATPGRLLSFLSSGMLKLDSVKHLVLDEADRMLDMGFYEDIMRIISYIPKERQTLLFSATMSSRIRQLAQSILKDPKEVTVAIAKPAAGIDQQVYLLKEDQKMPMLERILSEEKYQSGIIFSSRKELVKQLFHSLRKKGFACQSFHSDLEQNEREEIMRDFRNRKLRYLIGTDVLSRGIDVEGIDLVVNYDAPPDAEDYVHRIGRTARAASTGTAVTFIDGKDLRRFQRIEELIAMKVKRMPIPEELGPGLDENNVEKTGFNNKKKPFRKKKGKPNNGGQSAPRPT
jgi:ATP-dependent RNA helicase RhlE